MILLIFSCPAPQVQPKVNAQLLQSTVKNKIGDDFVSAFMCILVTLPLAVHHLCLGGDLSCPLDSQRKKRFPPKNMLLRQITKIFSPTDSSGTVDRNPAIKMENLYI